MNNADKMPIRALKRRGPCSANYLPLLMMIILMLSLNTLLTPTIPPPCTPTPKPDIYTAAPAPHQCVLLLNPPKQMKESTVFRCCSSLFVSFVGVAEGCPCGRVFFWITNESGTSPQQCPFSPRSTRLHKVKVCVWVSEKPGGGGLSLVGLAYNSDRARELKAAQRYDGQAKWSRQNGPSVLYLNR